MSWNTIYTGSFNDNVLGDKIDIYIKQYNFTGEPSVLILDANPLVISYPKKDFDAQIFGSGCKINIINNTDDLFRYDTLFSTPERYNYVEITKTTKIGGEVIYLFQGYILPEMYSTSIEKNKRITIPATDQLSLLDRYTPLILIDTSTYRADEFLNAFDIIGTILIDGDITTTLLINNSIENVNYIKDTSSTIFNNIFLMQDNFVDKKTFYNNKQTLEAILKSFYSRCYYSNNKWYIERVKDMGKDYKNFISYENIDYLNSIFYDGSIVEPFITSITYPNTRINLSNHDVVSKSATLTYDPGNQKIRVKLKYKEENSLTDSLFSDFSYYVQEGSSNKPLPKLKRWMMSATDASLDASTFTNTMVDNGLYYYKRSGVSNAIFSDLYASTLFAFTPNPELTILDIKYSLYPYTESITTKDISSLNSDFSLRGIDSSGNTWYISKSTPNDTSTYWSNLPYKFNSSVGWEDVVDKKYVWDISKQVEITDPINENITRVKHTVDTRRIPGTFTWWTTQTNTNPTVPEYIGQLYLDIYPMSKTSSYEPTFTPYKTWLSNVIVGIDKKEPYNVREASMGYFYKIKETELEIFNNDNLSFTNGVYNVGYDHIVRTVPGFRDASFDNYIPLEEKYIEDVAQMLSTPKYSLDIDVISRDSSLFTVGNIYTIDFLKYPDSSLINLMCNGYDYNVKENTYRLNLMEYIGDDGWRVDPASLHFNINPSTFYIISASTYGEGLIDTNRPFSYNTLTSWINTDLSGNYIVFTANSNTGVNSRDGSIAFYPTDLSTYIVNIYQAGNPPDPNTLSILGDNPKYFLLSSRTPCGVNYVDISSNQPWTAEREFSTTFSMSPMWGNVGVTRCNITMAPTGSAPTMFNFFIGTTQANSLEVYSTTSCP